MLNLLHTESSMNLGGQELRVLAEMAGLAGRGYRSHLAARPGSRILQEALGRGLDAYAVEMRGSIDPAAVFMLAKLIRSLGINVVNAHGSKDGWSAGLAARLMGVPVVRSRHVANPIRRHFFGRLVYGPLCDVIVTTSESIKEGMAMRGADPSRIISVPTGVDTDTFNPGVQSGAFKRDLGLDPDTQVVGMVSVLRGDKGPDIFVRAADAVLSRNAEAVFALVGDGWMREKLEGMAAASRYRDRIIITGYRRDIPNVLADLAMLVLPATSPEGVPQAVLQAHAMKVPVVASEIGGVNEVAIDGKTAVCVPPGDHAALASVVLGLLSDKARAEELAGNGYRLVMEQYTLASMLGAMDGIYRSVVAGGAAFREGG